MHQIPLRFPDARVVAESATATGAANFQHASTPDTAKHSGEAAGQIARARRVKRAHQRAVRRARNSEDGTTMYRGRRLTLEQLGGAQESAVVMPPRPPQLPPSPNRRIRILSKNVGGLCTSTHDVFMNWLTSARNPYDVVFLQETHHGLGRAFTEYKVPGWTVISSPDPSHRWAGVALYISERLASGKHKALVASIRIPAFYAKARELDLHLQTRLAQATVSTAAELTRAPRERIQIRGPDNTILDPTQEFQHIYEYFTHLYQQGPDTCSTTYVLQHDYNVTDTEILTSLKQQKAGKAVPQGKVPPDVWKRCAHLLLPHVRRLFQQHLSAGAIDLPTDWRDGWLHLLPKPHKPTKTPANLRPIALQCPLGKCLARIIKTRILTHILPRLDQVPQYAYLPGRSTTNAISRIARHCREARQQLSGLRREVHDRRAGKACIQARGAALLSIDMSKAFDQVSHSYLAAAMRHLEIDEDTIQLTLALHQASYHIKHHQHEGCIALRNGIRQGCVLSPLLWVCVTTYMLHCLSQRTSLEWVRDEVTAFADDFICSFTLHKVEDAQLMSQRIQQLFLVLREAGMQANAEKSHFLVKAVGGPLHRWLAKRSFRQRGALFYDMGTPFEPLKLAYSSSIDYLGVVVSYGAFEQHSMDKRLRAARANQALLALKELESGTHTFPGKLQEQTWQAQVRPPFKMPLSAEEEVNQCFGHHLRAMATQEEAAATKRSPPREEGQASKWHKPSNKGSRGKGQNWSQSWGQERWQREWHGEEQTLSQKISGDELREVVGLLARLALKHEDTEAALRSDTSFMLYFNTRGMTITRALYNIAQDWRKLKDEGKLNQSLRVTLIIGMLTAMKEKMQTALHEEVRPSLEKHSWLTKANPPAWAYMTYNQEKEEQEVDAIKPPLPHAQAEATIQRIFELISMEGLLMKFHATRPMAPTYRSEVLPFVLMVSNRGALADELHNLLSILCNNACLSLIG
ncbi:unnamed protein product, partial [Symbiodinium necroappetens]